MRSWSESLGCGREESVRVERNQSKSIGVGRNWLKSGGIGRNGRRVEQSGSESVKFAQEAAKDRRCQAESVGADDLKRFDHLPFLQGA